MKDIFVNSLFKNDPVIMIIMLVLFILFTSFIIVATIKELGNK